MTEMIASSPISDGTWHSRLLETVEGRFAALFSSWLATRPLAWRDRVGVIDVDGFIGFKTVTTKELPEAVAPLLRPIS